MPITASTPVAAGSLYGSPFVDGPRDVEQITVDISSLTFKDGSGGEVDGNGYIIPGVPLVVTSGAIVSGATDIVGVVIEPVKVPTTTVVDADADLDAITDFQINVARGGLLNRDMIEDNMGRVLSANELASLQLSGLRVSET